MKITCIKGRGVSFTSLDKDRTMIVSFEEPTLSFKNAEPLKASLRETIRRKADEGYLHFILNFQNVTTADSTGLGLVPIANNVTASRNVRLYLCHICPVIAGVLNTMRISEHLSIFGTEEEALAEVRKTG